MRRDDGATLIELIVYVGLAAVILGLMTSVFSTAWQSQVQTTERDYLTGRAALIGETLQTGIRSARWFDAAADGATLRARVLTGATESECRAWVITGSGDFLYRSAPSAFSLLPALDAQVGDVPIGWESLTDLDDADDVLSAEVTGAFERVGQELRYRLTLSSEAAQIPLNGGVTAPGAVGGSSC